MAAKDVGHAMQHVIATHGPWTAHSIRLTDDIHTLEPPQEDARLRRMLQIAADVSPTAMSELRVLDLGCLEGQFALEFGLHGATVLGIEGRAANLAKAKFARDLLGLTNVDFREQDVRSLSRTEHGEFDVVLCLGLLYHLDAPDVMDLVEAMFACCRRALIIDTHFALKSKVGFEWNGANYSGQWRNEYPAQAEAERDKYVWSSIGNHRSFHFTLPSLCNLLRHVGFTSVYECLNPYEYHNPDWPGAPRSEARSERHDRTTLVALKGERQVVLTSPATASTPERDRPEVAARYRRARPLPGFTSVGAKLPRRIVRALQELFRRRAA